VTIIANGSFNKDIDPWEGEGGAALGPPGSDAPPTSRAARQADWAVRIRHLSIDEFDRVAASIRPTARGRLATNGPT